MSIELAECNHFSEVLFEVGNQLDHYLQFQHQDALQQKAHWQSQLDLPLPQHGLGMSHVLSTFEQIILPNGSAIAKPGFSGYITTGATTIGVAAQAIAALAGTQRIGINAFSQLEEISLNWLKTLFGLPNCLQGLYTSGGSVANLVSLGAARQNAYEKKGLNPAELGCSLPGRIYTTAISHRTLHRAAAVLGLGRQSVCCVESDELGRMCPKALDRQVKRDLQNGFLPIAICCNAGATGTGVIDPISDIIDVAKTYSIWVHVDGAYGLPGILDPRVSHLFAGIGQADSVIVDPHKWLGAPVGIGATFVKDKQVLRRAFAQGKSDYLEGSALQQNEAHSMDSLGEPYFDYGVELSAPCRGAIVWALLSEIGGDGLRQRVCRHNYMARWLAQQVNAHPNLELLQPPTLSICCFRYIDEECQDLNALNQRIHRALVRQNLNIPTTTMINGQLALRPCFIGARTTMEQAKSLLNEVLKIGNACIQKVPKFSDHTTHTDI